MMLRAGGVSGEKLESILKEGAAGTLTVDYPEQLPDDWRSGIYDQN